MILNEHEYLGCAENVYPLFKLIPLTKHLHSQGVSYEAMLAGTEIPVSALIDADALISRQQLMSAFKNFTRLSKKAASALELGLSFRVTDYGFWGYALLSAASLREAIIFSMKYRELIAPIVKTDFIETSTDAIWQLEPLAESVKNRALCQFILEYQIGINIALHKGISGGNFQLKSVSFQTKEPPNATVYEMILGCPVKFESKKTEIRFELHWLDTVPVGANVVNFKKVQLICQEMLSRIEARRGILGAIYRILFSQSGRCISLDEMANLLGKHPRTLRRKIALEGASYQMIVDEVRFRLAVKLHTQDGLTYEAISERLGFSDPSSFRRAYKRWNSRFTIEPRLPSMAENAVGNGEVDD